MLTEEQRAKRRAYNAKYAAEHRASINAARRRRLEVKPEPRAIRLRNYRQRYPEKQRAHKAVEHAVSRGKIVKPLACISCGATGRLEAHHADYSKPLDVMWLCRSCHRTIEGKVCYEHIRSISNLTLGEAK